jgi:hypothetical protein
VVWRLRECPSTQPYRWGETPTSIVAAGLPLARRPASIWWPPTHGSGGERLAPSKLIQPMGETRSDRVRPLAGEPRPGRC